MTNHSQVFETTKDLSASGKQALRNLLLACTDTKLFLGYHYGEWTFGPPALEAAIACCSLCQTELGHVRLLHAILNTHYGDDPDDLVEKRAPKEFANVSYLDHEIKDWAGFVAANYLVDLAITTVLYAMKESSFKPLHMSLAKMLQEERYHIHHGQGWFRTLAQKNSDTKSAIENSANAALRSVLEWFGPADSEEDKELVALGIKSVDNEQIKQNFLTELGKLSESLGLRLELSKNKSGQWRAEYTPKWDAWNANTRRIGDSAPDENILYHLRGSKNKVFKLN